VFRFVRLLFSGHQTVAVENLALRLQLAAFKRKRKRPCRPQWDRLFWAGMSRLWSGRMRWFLFSLTPWSAGKTVPQVLGPTISTKRSGRRRPAIAAGIPF
jgi:hypothetical protein